MREQRLFFDGLATRKQRSSTDRGEEGGKKTVSFPTFFLSSYNDDHLKSRQARDKHSLKIRDDFLGDCLNTMPDGPTLDEVGIVSGSTVMLLQVCVLANW